MRLLQLILNICITSEFSSRKGLKRFNVSLVNNIINSRKLEVEFRYTDAALSILLLTNHFILFSN